MNELWQQLAARASITLSEAQHHALEGYLDLLLAANQCMNLTRITDRSQARLHHIADSLTLLPFLPPGSHKLADVGSGGGVPGIPLAIARPDAVITLIESTKKKAAFLREAASSMSLHNVSVIDSRVEDFAHGPDRASFDIVAARAVATLNWLVEWCLPLVKIDGVFLAAKGPKVAEEIPLAEKALRTTGAGAPVIHPVDLPGVEHHVIVQVIKKQKSDPRLPRAPSQAKGKPLI